MSPRTAQTIVILVGVGLFGYTGIRYLLGQNSGGAIYKQLWAIGAVTLLLTLLADLVPEIAGPFALMVGIAYVLAGKGFSDLLSVASSKTTPSTYLTNPKGG